MVHPGNGPSIHPEAIKDSSGAASNDSADLYKEISPLSVMGWAQEMLLPSKRKSPEKKTSGIDPLSGLFPVAVPCLYCCVLCEETVGRLHAPLPTLFPQNERRAGKFDGNYLAVSPYNVEAADGWDGELLLLLNLEGQVVQTHSSQGALHLVWGWVRGLGLGIKCSEWWILARVTAEEITSKLFYLRCFLGLEHCCQVFLCYDAVILSYELSCLQ